MGYKRQVAWGFSWLGILKVITKGLTLGKIIILARILAPRDFGLFGLVTVMLSLTEIFTETGINPFLIQTTKNPNVYFNSAWVVSIIRGCIIGAVVAGSSVFISGFYNEPTLLQFLLIASIIPVIKGFINPAEIKFQRDLQYHKDVYLRVALVAIDVVCAMAFALYFKSAIGLILSQVVAAVAEVIITHLLISPRPIFTFKKSQFWEIVHFGKWLNIAGLFSFLGNNVDDLIIGKMMGTQTLGYYQNAFSIAQSGIGEVGDLSAQASFPVLSRISGDLSRLQRALYMALIGLAMLLAIPLMFIVFFNRELVLIILGDKWLPVIPVLPWLAGAAYLQALNTLMHVPNMTRHKTGYSALMAFVYFILMICLLIPFSRQYGLVGAGIALFLARLLLQPVSVVALLRVLYKKKI